MNLLNKSLNHCNTDFLFPAVHKKMFEVSIMKILNTIDGSLRFYENV